MEETIKARIEQVRKNIEIAKAKSPYKQDVKLIAVSKTVGLDAVQQAIDCNVTDFGENKPQELKKKAELINQNVSWHQIGTLQTNKIKYIIDKVKLIHSLDRENLAAELDKKAKERDIIIQCLVQINISQEDSKHGLPYNEAEEFVKKISETYSNVQIVGLMGMAPYLENPQDTRPYFKKMRELFQEINLKQINNITLRELSMGMSNDYEIAIEEGATLVRVGTKIFGERIYL